MPIYNNLPEGFYPRPSDVDAPLRSPIGMGPRGPKGHSITAEVIDTDPYGYFRVQFKDAETDEVFVTTPNLDVGSRFFVYGRHLEDVVEGDRETVNNYDFTSLQASSDRSAIRVGDLVFFTTSMTDETFLAVDTIGIGIVNSVNGTEVSFIVTNIMNAQIRDGGITTGMLDDLCVTTAKIADGAVTTAKIADNAVTTAKIIDNAVTNDKMAQNSVGTVNIIDSAITTEKVADNSITENKIEDLSITNSKLASNKIEACFITSDPSEFTYDPSTYTLTVPQGAIWHHGRGYSIQETTIDGSQVQTSGCFVIYVKPDNTLYAYNWNSFADDEKDLLVGYVYRNNVWLYGVDPGLTDGSVTTRKIANEAVTNSKLDPTGLIQYDFAEYCTNDSTTYLVTYDTSTNILTLPASQFIYRNGRGYASSAQTINLTDVLASRACVLKVGADNLVYGVNWQVAATTNVGDKFIGYVYGDNVVINGIDQSRIRVTDGTSYQVNPSIVGQVGFLMSVNPATYVYSTHTLQIPAGFGAIGHKLMVISAQTVDLSTSLSNDACYLYMTQDGTVYGVPFGSTRPWAPTNEPTDALVGFVYGLCVSINGYPDGLVCTQSPTGYSVRQPISAMLGTTGQKTIVFDMSANTLYIPAGFYITSRGEGRSFSAKTVDVSVRTSYSGACLIWLLDRNTFTATPWENWRGPTPTAALAGYIYNATVRIFGLEEENIFIKQMPSPVWCFGDSITAGTSANVPYHQVWNKMSMRHSFKNWGVGSTGYVVETSDSVNVGGGAEGQGPSTAQSGNNSIKKVMQSVSGSPACITIAAGTNDWGSSVPIADFRTAVADAIDYALTRTNRVLVISPIRRDIANDATNSIGLILSDYADVIKEEAEARGANFASGFDVFFNPHIAKNKTAFAPDGLHPNNLGHEIMARTWYQKLLESLGE